MNRRSLLKTGSLAGMAMMTDPLKVLSALTPANELTRAAFGPDFKWGVATAAYQIEGAWNKDGKGPSIWDTYTHKPKNIKDRTNADVSCDFYHLYESDLELLKSLNFGIFRFSIAWTRIFPEGKGKINPKGIAYYHKVIDKCLELGLEPWITTYHWDLPQALEDEGGWMNRDIIEHFCTYVDTISREYGDKVKNWMVLNEPTAFTLAGYFVKYHAPGRFGPNKFMAATHHAAMCQAEGGRILKANVSKGHIGSTFSVSKVYPKDDRKKHVGAAHRMDILLNRLFLEPALGMGYPRDNFKLINRIDKYIKPGDEEKLAIDFDFIGIQNYFRFFAKKALIPYVWAYEVKPEKRGVPPEKITAMGWEAHPEGFYHILKQIGEYKNLPPVIVTENGSAFHDEVVDGRVHDKQRLEFYQGYMASVLRAKNEGMDIRGYFCWSFLDNFEWSEGFEPRFGLVHVDYETQRRTVKDSGLWFKEFLK